jgi:hypothetical protein
VGKKWPWPPPGFKPSAFGIASQAIALMLGHRYAHPNYSTDVKIKTNHGQFAINPNKDNVSKKCWTKVS